MVAYFYETVCVIICLPVCLHICICLFKGGNDFSDDPTQFDDLRYVQKPAMLVSVRVEEPKIVFDPVLNDSREIIHSCFNEVIDSAKDLPRVSVLHFYLKEIYNIIIYLFNDLLTL